MNRYKNFNSTGVAPDGKLFAGDLNAIQDAAAALADFAQTVDLSTLRIGDTGIQLSKFGTGEAQFSGHLRTLGILRGLGGIIPGAFTTTQRDAIAVGGAPYGMAILNTTKNAWEWNNGTDVARNWVPLGQAQSSTFATMPAAGQPGRTWYDSTNKLLWLDTGTRWMVLDGQIGDFVMYSGPVGSLSGEQVLKPGRLLCNGASVLRADYADLRALWGVDAYGTDPDGTHMRLPNALGRVMVIRDGAIAPFDTLGETGGEVAHQLTIPELAAHDHPITDPGHVHGGVMRSESFGTSGSAYLGVPGNTNTATTGITVNNRGGDVAHNNLQPYLVIGALLVKF